MENINNESVEKELVKLEEKFEQLNEFVEKVCEDYAARLKRLEEIVKD